MSRRTRATAATVVPVADSKRERTADGLIAAATGCFARKGFAATTLDDIAEAAGVSRATAYRRHGGKWAYVDAVILAEADELIASLETLLSRVDTAEDLIRVLVGNAMRVIAEQPVMSRAAGPDIKATLPRFSTESHDTIAYLTARLTELLLPLRGVVLPRVDEDTVALFCEESVRFVLARVTTPTLDGLSRDPDAAAERAVMILVPAILSFHR